MLVLTLQLITKLYLLLYYGHCLLIRARKICYQIFRSSVSGFKEYDSTLNNCINLNKAFTNFCQISGSQCSSIVEIMKNSFEIGLHFCSDRYKYNLGFLNYYVYSPDISR